MDEVAILALAPTWFEWGVRKKETRKDFVAYSSSLYIQRWKPLHELQMSGKTPLNFFLGLHIQDLYENISLHIFYCSLCFQHPLKHTILLSRTEKAKIIQQKSTQHFIAFDNINILHLFTFACLVMYFQQISSVIYNSSFSSYCLLK